MLKRITSVQFATGGTDAGMALRRVWVAEKSWGLWYKSRYSFLEGVDKQQLIFLCGCRWACAWMLWSLSQACSQPLIALLEPFSFKSFRVSLAINSHGPASQSASSAAMLRAFTNTFSHSGSEGNCRAWLRAAGFSSHLIMHKIMWTLAAWFCANTCRKD